MTDFALNLPAHASGAATDRPARRGYLRWFRDRGVQTKILAAMGVLAAASIATGVVGQQALNDLDGDVHSLVSLQTGLVDNRAIVHQDQLKLRMLVAQMAATDDPKQVAAYVDKTAETDAELDAAVAAMSREHATRFMPQWQDFVDQFATWRTYRDETLIPLAQANKDSEYAVAAAGKSQVLIDDYLEHLDNSTEALASVATGHATEAAGNVKTAQRKLIYVLLGGLLLGGGLGLVVARGVVRPLRKVQDVLDALADGDLTRQADVDSRDEVGRMALALQQANDSLRAMVQTMDGSAQSLAAASEQLAATSDQIASSAEETSAQAGVVASASEQVSSNVQTVAAGTEEMGASIREIAQNAADAARVAAQAVTVAATTNETVSKLGDSSAEIGNVIKVITSIAEQTNLLALNATIEAARAGEAGKGFAVVANEVKDLAQETAKATEDISRRVEAIQADTQGAVSAIAEISEVIGRINDYQTTIAAAVEEQTATTNEMARNVSEAASGSSEIAQNVIGVASAAEVTTTGVAESQRAAADLARMSSELQSLVGQFRY
jgi:methyl-accepting chemotaxis protein